ncbi:MAG: hypothetical protein H6772_00870 [Pseudomonadales bacterium]|nr:hypothetical protein [Pseudomonadales bacterium]
MRKLSFYKIFLVIQLLILSILFVPSIKAQELEGMPSQESSQSNEIVPKLEINEDVNTASFSTQILNKKRNTQKIIDLKILYRDQIEAYRNSAKEFNVAQSNYFNVQTLTALEDAVNATRQAMKDRSKVLITYLELISATLEDTAGVEISLKDQSLKQIESLIITLRLHQDDIDLSKDRNAVNLLADSFEIFVEPYNQITYKALSLIRIGQMQAVYDVSILIDEDIKESKVNSEVGAVIQAKRDRAYQEIQRNFLEINNEFSELNNKIINGDEENFGRLFYERILRDLEPIYIQLSKSLDHLEELLKL